MGFHPVTIDNTVTNVEGGSIRVDEGTYRVKLVGITPSKEEYDGEPYFMWKCQFLEGPDAKAKGRTINYVSTFKEEAHFALGRIVNAIGKVDIAKLEGMSIANYTAFEKLAASLYKRMPEARFGVVLADNNYKGNTNSRIIECFPDSEWAERKGAVASASSTKTATKKRPSADDEDEDDFDEAVDELFG